MRPALSARRRVLLLAGLLPSLVAAVVAVGLVVVLVRHQAGLAATAQGDHATAREHFAANRWAGAPSPWVAAYDEGVASFRAGRPADALADFTAALEDAPADRECLVLHNAAVSWERLGDLARPEDDALALERYREGRAVLAGRRCLDRDDGPGGLVEQSRLLDERLGQKIRDLLARREREELARLAPEERVRVRRLEEQDLLADRREQRTRDRLAREPDEGEGEVEDYGW